MTDKEIIEKINTALAEEFELDEASMLPEAHLFDDLELDSLDLVDMVIVLEQTFGFKIREEEEIRSIRTLGDIHAFVIRKRHQRLQSS
ncbi:MAG: acyl carrier protein [Deltaproteobacteria bacterium]|nr:acyl carrier protein [Deltaproteobacteria bacterium]MBW1955085.1 acyl carrier protein [Deltaproteobacteria bacterium]MBW2041365.1 acyl carrier protein [Deltaproteobacteria bacterium]MBW2131519.1 acyl carrier protein [Deltaproteobacteria bacterium]